MYRQLGGLEPIRRVPPFKYTFSEPRKQFIGHIYPYADFFIKCINNVRLDEYVFNDTCEYIEIPQETRPNELILSNISSIPEEKIQRRTFSNANKPLMFYFGGTVYELLHQKYPQINLHNYCDATGDIDCEIVPPKIKTEDETFMGFVGFSFNEKITNYYSHFTRFVFDRLVENVRNTPQFIHIPGLVHFNIDEYDLIPEQNKIESLGFQDVEIGNLHVVRFLDGNMYRLQIVCKVGYEEASVIDHITEFVIRLPSDYTDESSVADMENVSPKKIDKITIHGITYNVRNYSTEITRNIMAYVERISLYENRETIHKTINHIARIFYLYELFYHTMQTRDFDLRNISTIPIYPLPKKDNPVKTLLEVGFKYYKIVDGEFHPITVSIFSFMYSYFTVMKMNFMFRNFISAYIPSLKLKSPLKNITDDVSRRYHDLFLEELFNANLFIPTNGWFIIEPETEGGNKKRRKTKKGRKSRRKTVKK